MLDISVIEYILDHGGSVKLPYKRNLPDWFATMGVSLAKSDNKYVIYGDGCYGKSIEHDTLEDALDEFATVHANNTGAIQEYIRMKHPHVTDQSGDLDWDEVKRLVKNEKRRRKRLEAKHG